MPKDLVDSPATFPVPVQVPKDGELATGAAFETPYQQLANRSAYLRDQLELLGTKRIRRVADFAALRAIADMVTFDVRTVDGYGLYSYDATAPSVELLPWLVRPTIGVGAWKNMLTGLRTQIDRAFSTSPFALSTTSTAWTDVPGIAVNLASALRGDRFRISLHASFNAVTWPTAARLVVNESGGPDLSIDEAQDAFYYVGGPFFRSWSVMHTVVLAGPVRAKLQQRVLAPGGRADVYGPISLVAEIVSP